MAADLSTTYFELFGLPPSFAVDMAQLDRRYRELQRTAHPDRFASASDQERRISMQQATEINAGCQILKDPLRRGRYLLELGGYRFDDGQHTNKDVEFLMEQMELRESLGDVREAADAFDALGKVMDRIATDNDRLNAVLHRQFAASDPDDDKCSDCIAETLTKMQFFHKLQEEAMELEITLEDEIG